MSINISLRDTWTATDCFPHHRTNPLFNSARKKVRGGWHKPCPIKSQWASWHCCFYSSILAPKTNYEGSVDHLSYTHNLWAVVKKKTPIANRQSCLHIVLRSLNILNLYISTCIFTLHRYINYDSHNMSRVLHRYRRGHGFESRSRLIFIQAIIHNCY